MQWLLHAAPAAEISAVGDALVRHGHAIHRPAELELTGESTSEAVLRAAAAKQWDVITSESTLAMEPFAQQRNFNRSIVYLQLAGNDAEMTAAIDRLFERFPRLTSGRLYTVTASRVKVRQLPRG